MARKKTQTRAVTVYSPPRSAPAPIIRIATPRAITRSAPKKHRRRHSGGGHGGNLKDRMVKMAIGGVALGYIEKSNMAASLPTIPMIGRKGTIAVAAYYLGGKKPGMLQDVAIAAAVLAGYELGKDGKISGDE